LSSNLVKKMISRSNGNLSAKGCLCLVLAGSLMPAAMAQQSLPVEQRVNALFFGEMDYREREDLGDDGFVIGQGVAQINFNLDDRLSVFSEMTATARKNEDFEFEVERLFVRYDFSDQYKLSVGRFHTPLGYWNASFHHGSWLQSTVGRPETVKFGSNVLPIHFVGALLEGNIADSDFGYRVGIGNGRSEEINDPGDFGDGNNNRAWLLSGNYRPLGRRRLEAGFSIYVDEVSPSGGSAVDEVLYTGYVALQSETPELIIEATHAEHDSAAGDGSVDSIYAQVAYRLSGKAATLKPYLRVEYLDVDDDDPLLAPLDLDYEGIIAGLRWDFSAYATLKAEVRSEEFGSEDRRSSVWLQLAFVFDATRSRRSIASNSTAGGIQ
jgi:hypothetical protein